MEKQSFFMSLIERITQKVESLDYLCQVVPAEMEYKRDERNRWNSWHDEWKKAWMEENSHALTPEEREMKRRETSITTRHRSL